MRSSTLLAVLPLAAASPVAQRSEPAPLYTRASVEAQNSDRYIVKFKEGSVAASVQGALARISVDATHHFQNVFQGFAAKLDSNAVEMLRLLPDVDYIEQDGSGSSTGYVTQGDSTWGLARISHRSKGNGSYTYDSTAGQGVCAYVTDSGVDERHPEFEGRAHQIKSFISNSNVDDLGHGTHCAGTIGSRTYGVAKKVEIYGVKVLSSDDRFQYSDLIAAWDFITQDAPNRNCPNGVVVSGSLGGGYSQSLNNAANSMVDKGYFMAIAAGNNNDNTSGYSPGSASKVCTVGGIDSSDRRYSDSNYGPLVDITGPAVSVLSTLPGGRTAYYTGTSMATPHIAGLAAYIASRDGVKASPSLCQRIVNTATKGAITNQSPNTVNLIAFNGNPSG
ncbi:hypothetical protein V2A60_006192 [Cordyceps javanica]